MLRLQNSTEPSPNPRSTHASGALEGHEIVQREIAPVGGVGSGAGPAKLYGLAIRICALCMGPQGRARAACPVSCSSSLFFCYKRALGAAMRQSAQSAAIFYL